MNRWDRINPNLCWRNIWIVPYPNFGNWWKVARVQLRGRIFFLKKGILWYPVGNLLLYVFSTIEASGTILDRYSRNLLFLMHYFRNFKPHFLRFAKGSFNNYVDRILQFFWPHPLAWIVFIPGAWTKTYFFLPPPPSTQLLNDPKSKGSFKNNIFTRHLKDQLWHTDFTYVLNNIGSLKAPFHGLHTVMPLAGGQSGLVHPEFGSSINPFPTRGVGADYTHHFTACSPGFENLMASLDCTLRNNMN